MADEGEEEVFEIDDFTAASEWERFIYRIEEIIGSNGWKLDSTDKKVKDEKSERVETKSQNGEWTLNKAELKFYNIDFLLTHRKLNVPTAKNSNDNGNTEDLPQALLDSIDFEHDFSPKSFPLSRWYGLKEFMILSPLNDVNKSESKIFMLWSSISIALSNSKCHVPMFIQVDELPRKLYFGTCIGGGFRTSYEMVQLKYTPHECNHVQGMIDTFKAKLACPLSSPITISVRFAYSIRDWPDELWFQNMLGPDSDFGIDVGVSSLNRMPFGPLQDPIRDFQVAAIWPYLSSDILVDDENSTHLTALYAPVWKLKARGRDSTPTLLSEALRSLCDLCQQRSDSTQQIIRSLSTEYEDETEGLSGNVGHALDRLTESTLTSSSIPSKILPTNAKRKVVKTVLSDSPLSRDLLSRSLEYLFPDAGSTEEKAAEVQKRLDNEQKSLECDSVRNKDKFRHLKTAPIGSLTYNLTLCVAILNYGYGGVQAVAHLWHEFVLEMRYRFENNIIIPGLSQTSPNLNYCLIHQKLQLLNCCIQRAIQRNQRTSSTSDSTDNTAAKSVGSDTSFASCASVCYKDYSAGGEDENIPTKSRSLESQSLSSKRDTTWNELLLNLEEEPNDKEGEGKKDKTWSELLSKIEPSNTRDKNNSTSFEEVNAQKVGNESDDDDEDEDDEFFEAQEEIIATDVSMAEEFKTNDKFVIDDDTDRQPDGVLRESDMKLLRTGSALCVPVTQEGPPLTEDMLMEQQDVMTRLGSSAEGSRVRVLMQCASLHSDMEAFKAANPGCILEDFVRWYSPNDWLPGPESEEQREQIREITKEKQKEEDAKNPEGWEFELDDDVTDILASEPATEWEEEGHLSLRMRIPGNTWLEVWNNAKPIPARRQKRLFDDTKEAEKVLHFFENLRPSELILHLFPIALQASVIRICEEDDSSKLQSQIDNILRLTAQLHTPSLNSLALIEETINGLYSIEMHITKLQSLRTKLYESEKLNKDEKDEEMESFLEQVLRCQETNIKGAADSRLGKTLTRLLCHQKLEEDTALNFPQIEEDGSQRGSTTDFPQPIGREYILRTYASRPSSFSRSTPQRLFTVITPDEFRMTGSFTQDTTFI